jgi:agmatine deiminase
MIAPLPRLAAAASYRMPAEWWPHAATWIAWPANGDDWPGRFGPIPWVYVEIVRRLSRFERVEILVGDEAVQQEAAAMLERAGVDGRQVRFHHVVTNRVWTRDYAPTFVESGSGVLAAVKWRFNAWARYDNWHQDDAAGQWIADHAGVALAAAECRGKPIVLEGGSIDVNGDGLLLTTEECLLGEVQVRNPGMTRADYEEAFAHYLGVEKVVWLGSGIVGDDTHGHIDDLARFVRRDTVVAVREPDHGDANHEPLEENWERLRVATDRRGSRLQIVPLPMPAPIIFEGQRLPASYANFYVANRLVLVPTFNDANDRRALATLAELFPEREVVGIHCGDLVWGLGTIHCLTQQQPA